MVMQMIIGGKRVNSQNNTIIEITNPATGTVFEDVPDAAKEDVEKAIDIACEGKKEWSQKTILDRSKILLEFVETVKKQKKELAALNCRETGKTLKECEAGIEVIDQIFTGYVEKAKHLYGISIPDGSQPWAEKDMIFTRREPLGVVVCIIPFNYPPDLFAHKVAPALITGNVAIVKPSSDNPLISIRLVELLLESGVPPAAVQVVTGRGQKIGQWLVSHPKVDAVSFTGSTDAGIAIAAEAAKTLKHVFLELGGNDALVVFDDADLDLAVQESVIGRTSNMGQICCAVKRLIVHDAIKDDFVKKLVNKLTQLKIGDPMDPGSDVGCLISERAAVEIEEQVKATVAQGAKLVYGGKRFNGAFFEPAVLTEVTSSMDVARDMEIFGPVFPIIGFKTLEEAVAIANNTKYGLMGAVITRNINKAMKVATLMECGGVVINGSGTYRTPDMAFGGYKMSGLGREGISSTLEEMTQVKTIVLKNVLA